jgi:hypothetical protein
MKYVDYLFESAHPGGTYACIIPSRESQEEILKFCVEQGFDNLVDPDEYHCTIIYSRQECPDVAREDFDLPCKALVTGFKILGDEKKVLVLELYCPNAVRLHELFMEKHGATHDYDEYIPHITIASDFTGELPLEIPEFEVEFNGQKVEELS